MCSSPPPRPRPPLTSVPPWEMSWHFGKRTDTLSGTLRAEKLQAEIRASNCPKSVLKVNLRALFFCRRRYRSKSARQESHIHQMLPVRRDAHTLQSSLLFWVIVPPSLLPKESQNTENDTVTHGYKYCNFTWRWICLSSMSELCHATLCVSHTNTHLAIGSI